MKQIFGGEAAPSTEEAARVEDYVEEARIATDHAYLLLRDGGASAAQMAREVKDALEELYHVGRGAQACALATQLLETLPRPDPGDPNAFEKGLRAGFAAGCLVQWRVLEYLIGEEMPLWPVQHYSSDRQVD